MLFKSVILSLLFHHGFSARILAIFPIPSISHQIVYDSVMVALAEHGHEIVTITTHPMKTSPPNIKQIDVSFSAKAWKDQVNYAHIGSLRPSIFYGYYKEKIPKIFEMQLQSAEVAKLLNDKEEHFDLIFVSVVYDQAFGFAHRFNGTPVIGIASLPTHYDAVGAPTHPVLYTEFVRKYLYDMTLMQRIETFFDYLYVRYVDWKSSFVDDESMKKYFGDDMPSVRQLKTQMDLLFLSANPLLVGVRPEVPAIVHIDGIHLKPKKPLPQDIQKFLDDSPQGVVYMSLGSNVHSKDLGNETLEILKEVFSELPYNVLWKFEADDLPGRPDNVLIKKWLPQQDLLGHKNIKAFIFQGGQQSLEEAIRDRIPLICIPFAVDQFINAQKIERMNLGLPLDVKTLTKEQLTDAIMRVATDPSFKATATELSKKTFDQPMSPKERAIWWTEYVLRHKGAKHLRAPAVGISYTEYFMLDVFLALLVLCLIVISSLIGVIYAVIKCLRHLKTNKIKTH